MKSVLAGQNSLMTMFLAAGAMPPGSNDLNLLNTLPLAIHPVMVQTLAHDLLVALEDFHKNVLTQNTLVIGYPYLFEQLLAHNLASEVQRFLSRSVPGLLSAYFLPLKIDTGAVSVDSDAMALIGQVNASFYPLNVATSDPFNVIITCSDVSTSQVMGMIKAFEGQNVGKFVVASICNTNGLAEGDIGGVPVISLV